MRRKKKTGRPANTATTSDASCRDTELRIIGGRYRGRRLRYHGDPLVRPMKHRTREAIFNLVSTDVTGRHAIDLFAGTGALGLEALSRGAAHATFIEQHVPTARVVGENIRTLGVEDRATLLVTSAFLWARRDLPLQSSGGAPWLVFCSPPYAFYVDRLAEMLDLIQRIQTHAPPDSIVVVESDQRFEFERLFGAAMGRSQGEWRERSYPPAVVRIWRSNSQSLVPRDDD